MASESGDRAPLLPRAARMLLLAATMAADVGSTLAAQQVPAVPGAPIPVDSIPEQARDARLMLAGLPGRPTSDSVIDRLDSLLGAVRAASVPVQARTSREHLEVMYLEDLADLQTDWEQLQGRLAAWRAQATSLAERVDAALDTLGRLAERWRLTRATSWRELPPSVRDQVTGAQQATDSALRDLRPVRDRLLSLVGRGSPLDVDIAARIEDLRSAQARARRQLLRQNRPFLWKVFAAPDQDTVRVAAGAEEPQDKFDAAAEYLLAHTGRLRLHLALFLIAAFAMWFIGGRRSTWATAEFALHWPSELLAHPIAAGWLLTLAFTRLLYPGAPRGVFGLAFLLLVPALVILLRQLLGAGLRGPAYALLGLLTFRVLADTFDWHPTVARFALLVVALAGLAVSVWFARYLAAGGGATAAERRWGRVGLVLASAGAGLLGIAVFANVFGFVTLADLLTTGVLGSELMALALVALMDVLVGALFVALLATPVGRLQVVRRNRDLTTQRVRSVVQAAGILVWMSLTLQQFRLLRLVTDALTTFLAMPLSVGSWTFTAGAILLFGVTVWLSVYVARGLRAVLRDDVLARMELDRGVPEAAASIVYYVALALGLIFAAGAAGVAFGRLALVAGALGVGIGFGLQSIVANFISGLVLLVERPIHLGDTIELEGLNGVVQRIGMRASTVRTFQGADVIVPNQNLIAGRLVNWTLSDQTRRVDIPIGVAYGSDPSEVMLLVRQAAQRHPKVEPQPPVAVLLIRYGESSLDFELRLWTRTEDWPDVRSDILVAVYQAFAEHGIDIPFPQRDLHVRSVDPKLGDALRPPSSA